MIVGFIVFEPSGFKVESEADGGETKPGVLHKTKAAHTQKRKIQIFPLKNIKKEDEKRHLKDLY